MLLPTVTPYEVVTVLPSTTVESSTANSSKFQICFISPTT